MVEGTGLENQQACKRLVGSNPTPSAIFNSFKPSFKYFVVSENFQFQPLTMFPDQSHQTVEDKRYRYPVHNKKNVNGCRNFKA